jgi:hypothetical membrane protein
MPYGLRVLDTKEKPMRHVRALLAGGVAGPLLFVVVFLVEGVLRADYNPVRQPVSSLSIGPSGWVQVANFVVTGLLLLAFAVGLRPVVRRLGGGIWAPLLLALVGLGLIGAGIFVTDPLGGYPPGTPLAPENPTTSGTLHDLFSTPVFTCLPAAAFVLAYRFGKRGQRAWSAGSAAVGVAVVALFVLTSIGFSQQPGLASVAGLLQRLTLIVGFGWIAALAIRSFRSATE